MPFQQAYFASDIVRPSDVQHKFVEHYKHAQWF